jgi:hypothetical protein
MGGWTLLDFEGQVKVKIGDATRIYDLVAINHRTGKVFGIEVKTGPHAKPTAHQQMFDNAVNRGGAGAKTVDGGIPIDRAVTIYLP